MASIERAKRSPAILIVPLVLVAAIAGSAVAGSSPNANSAAKVDKALKKAKKAIKIARAADKEQGPTGSAGPAGPTGPQGATGAQGAAGADSANIVMAQTTGLSTSSGDKQYIFPVGVSTPGAENDREAVIPSGDGILITDFRVAANGVLGAAGDGYRATFRENNADLSPTNLTCQFTGNITGCSVPQTAEVSFPGNLAIEFETLNTPNADIEVAVSYRMQVAPAP